ncbi:ATP-binding cassette domain-containing protein [Vallitalea guaymasensis]|uniref:ABC transporter ATP-binding protein n=1 Tax=Vallitalea guaymasensis TaxID=1185412 RepID=A0A8J8M852_9FIRM|nr:ABC transporter ATP-binding protein [Vallitalea guaymasensis]QUH27973.1 ABC transporter ATP-binding protein [Vallitalea guaymasensis]
MIQLNNLTKKYGKANALSNINIEINENKIYCLLGENGAGKTTFLRTISGLTQATKGEVLVNGLKVNKLSMPEIVCFVEERENHINLKIKDLISLAADFQDGFDTEFADDMIKKFNLNPDKKFKKLSFGMKTMVNTIIGLASTNKIVLFDEPVLGFDVIMRNKFYSLLEESIARHPKIIIVSTHLIDEIAKIAEEIIIIHKGELLLRSNIIDLQDKCYSVTGIASDVDKAVMGKNIINVHDIGKFKTVNVYDTRIEENDRIQISNEGLQDFFANLIGGEINE